MSGARDLRIAAAIDTLREIERAVARQLPAPRPEAPYEERNRLLYARIDNAVRLYCALDVGAAVYNTGSR